MFFYHQIILIFKLEFKLTKARLIFFRDPET
jgi:hypothetical protein